ncbi:Anti-ECFsigma factor, ChrR [Paraburkholderia piptadeniae]|uniref:Anti-sigma factor n=2 Tax=Paraburkholderia TaxID=1822464 RepID=A0A7X1TIH4_9BURK|nr:MULTISPECIES: cupin domain-containing protein [Paraburkholderia]MPW20460.1 anti-sigma factor [Paraburkholderia franconis]SIT50889.1 Anti-ECFsigma factor, ChrR [Paraburkholderia piptadeniae]
MLVNADFSRPVVVTPDRYDWVASPQSGVERVILDRIGEEQARATSIVRYAAGSHFPGHAHPRGEEIFVLSGTFSERDDHYPAGWYLRNPPGSIHQPSSAEGAIIFVKLRQMHPGEHHRVRIDTRDPGFWQRQGRREVCPLFSSDTEQVCLQRLSAGEALFDGQIDGAELLVLAGNLVVGKRPCDRGSWVRLPVGKYPEIVAGPQGATCYLKTGHLANRAAEA